jgi:CDP-2,3-bis-(O-geranylgeranyl)-sn-glycerol synthase
MSLHTLAILRSLLLISAANGAPILFKRVFSVRFAGPIDGGLVLQDGHPLLGSSKTWRGLVAGVFLAACASLAIDLPWQVGALIGASAMVDDCVSSFAKRRFGLESSSMALGLDQIPESLLPAVVCSAYLPLGALDVGAIVLVFFVGELGLSRLFFAIRLHDRPY